MRQLGVQHVVQGWPPFDLAAGNSLGSLANSTTQSRTISLKYYDHVVCIFNWGVTSATANATINFYACSNVAGANAAALDSFSWLSSPLDTLPFAHPPFYFKTILNKLYVVYELFLIRRYGLRLLH